MAEIMYVDWDGLVYYDTRSKQYIKDLVDQTIKFGGHYVLEDVPAPGIETLHVAYKITDKFVVSPETAYFLKTCAGKTFEAGTVILVVEDGESDTYRFDILFEAYSGTPITPDGELDLSNYYTQAEVDDLLAGKVNASELDRYYLKTETDNLLADKADKSDLDGLATKAFVAAAVSAIEVPEVPTKVSDLENDAGYITEHQDISGKADVEHTHTLSDIVDYEATDLTGYATEEFVNKKIAEAELADKEADLEAYYTKTEVDALIPDVSNFITEVPAEYVTETELEAKGYITEHQSLDDYALKTDVPTNVSDLTNDAGYITEHIDISGKADIGHTHSIREVTDYEAPNLEPYALKTDIPSVEGLATETYVKNAIAEAELNEKEVDLTGYATKDELTAVEAKIPSIEGLATETFVTDAINQIPEADFSNYYNKTETENIVNEAVGNISIPDISTKADKEHTHNISDITDYVAPDLSEYAKLTDIPDVSNFITSVPNEYVTEDELQLALDNIEHPIVDLTGYATEDWVTAQNYITDVSNKADLDHKHTLSDITDYIEPDLSSFATKEELTAVENAIPNVSEFATEDYVDSAIDQLNIPSSADFATVDDFAKIGYTADDITLVEYIAQTYSTKDEVETSIDQAIEELNLPGTLSEYATDAELKDAIDAVEHKIVTKTSQLENDAGFLTTGTLPDFVTPEEIQDLVTLAEVEEAGFIKSIPNEYITETELTNYGYVTEDSLNQRNFITDVSNKADVGHTHSYNELTDTPTIPSIDGLATEQYVNDAIANIDVPTVDTTNLLTKDEATTLLATKANDVPFADDYRVGTALGGFVVDESLRGMTIVQILTKLLGLTQYVAPSDNVAEGSSAVVTELVTTQKTTYMIGEDGTPVENTYEYRVMTTEEAKVDNQEESFLYQIVDEETGLVESGYQIATVYQENDYLTVYIPESITQFHVEEYSALAGDWSTPTWSLVENTNYTMDGYKAYTVDAEILSGISIRIVIEN